MRFPFLFVFTLLPLLGQECFSLAPSGGDRFESREFLASTSKRICSRSTVSVSRTSATVLAIASDSSATDRNFIRFNNGTVEVTGATTTATIDAGSGSGKVYIYARRPPGGSLTIYVGHDLDNTVLSCAGSPGCTVITNISRFPGDAVPLYSWTVTNGNWDVSGGTDEAANKDCWIDEIELTNVTAGAVTVTLTTGDGLDFLDAVSLAANSTSLIVLPCGSKFEDGAVWSASVDDSIIGKFRLVKQK